ncbi:replication endonuclease, partial [Escherichia coli]|nr:replication endonuclease [Escherichia coli]
LRSLTPIQRKQLTQQLKNDQKSTKTVKTGGPAAPDDVICMGQALPPPDLSTDVINLALNTTGEALHSGAALSVREGARVRLPDGRIVHWDEKSRSMMEAVQEGER